MTGTTSTTDTPVNCPRCDSLMFTFTDAQDNGARIVAGTSLDAVPGVDSDNFGSLTCDGCSLTLGNDSGEGRLRRAALYDTAEDHVNLDPALDDPTAVDPTSVMYRLAGDLCDGDAFLPMPLTALTLTVTGPLTEAQERDLDAAAGRTVVTAGGAVLTAGEDVITRAETYLRINRIGYVLTRTSTWTPRR